MARSPIKIIIYTDGAAKGNPGQAGWGAVFLMQDKKSEKISECILITDSLKFLISVAWEGKLISNRHYEDTAMKLEEIGRMLGGWKNSLANPEKKNRNS